MYSFSIHAIYFNLKFMTDNSENRENEASSVANEIPIVFYCKDCRALVESEKIGNKYMYKCLTCGGENVAFGTPKSIANYYHVK